MHIRKCVPHLLFLYQSALLLREPLDLFKPGGKLHLLIHVSSFSAAVGGI